MGITEYSADEVHALIGFHNTGNIFAKDVHIFVRRKLSANDNAWLHPFVERDHPGTELVIAPRATLISGTPPILTSKIDTSRDFYLYVWGIVRYHDGFIGGRFTRFCHRYNFAGCADGKFTLEAESGRYHQHSNAIDDQD